MHDLIGYAAGILTTAAFLPQVTKSLKTGKTQDISLSMYLLLVSGVALWLVYGLMIHSTPVIVSNIVTLALAATVLVLKLRNG